MQRKGLIVWGLIVFASVFLVRGVGWAGTVIDQNMIDVWGKKSGLVLFYSKKRLRIDQKDGKLSTIMDFRKDRIVILDHPSRTYVSYPFSWWEKQVSQKIQGDQRTQSREIRVESTGAERLINGFKTRQIHVFIDNALIQDCWVTQDVNLEEMFTAIKEGVGRLTGLSEAEMAEKEEIYRKIIGWGFPILTHEYQQIGQSTLREIAIVNRVETRMLTKGLFGPPRGYKQRTP